MENFPNAWIFEKFLLESDGGVFEIYMIKQDISEIHKIPIVI